MKETRRSFLLSVTALILCFAMLLGSTFAWFTDIVTSSNNKIKSGSLDLDLQLKDKETGKYSSINESSDPVFDYDNWEPGYTDVKVLKVLNAGSLSLKWVSNFVSREAITKLAEVIDVYVKTSDNDIAYPDERTDLTSANGWKKIGALNQIIDSTIQPVNGQLLPGEADYFAVALHMQESAGNEYQNTSVGAFDITVHATQYTAENDSFGSDYDQNAQWPSGVIDGTIVASSAVTTDENGKVTTAVTMTNGKVSATVPAGTQLVNGTTSVTVTVSPVRESQANVTMSDTEKMLPVDVHIDGVAENNDVPIPVYLAQWLDVGLNIGNYHLYHVENGVTNEMTLRADNATPVHNNFDYDPATGDVTLYLASFSEIALVAEPSKWEGNFDYSWYDADATELKIANADQLAAFGAIVGGMAKDENGNFRITYTDSDGDEHHNDFFENKTVTLLADINLGDKESENDSDLIFYPIGYWNSEGKYEKTGTAISSGFYAFKGTFDGNGNTISNFYQNTWEMKGDHDWYDLTLQYYRDGMGLFGKILGGTVKNLTVDNFSCDSEIGTSGVIAAYADSMDGKPAVFENITITNCNPRVYNIGNGGIVGCAGWYSRNESLGNADYTNAVTFRNITVDQTNKISALWGSWGVSCAGILGQYYPNSNCGIKLENCHVAAIIDVNNDVCSNYQYYWYRYAGMFIGTIRANTTDANGYTVADTTGVTATGCTYTMGNWNEYWYCEIVANSLASYTHDHQFSRLDNIYNLSEISDDNGKTWKKEGHFALLDENRDIVDCYHIFKNSEGKLYRHFHDVADESNPNIYESFDLNGDGELNDLKEDRQCYFIPFNQLLTGLDMGIKAHTEFEGITHVEDGTVESEKKFESLGTVTTYRPGQTITLGQLVNSIVDDTKLSKASVYAAVSPATESDTVSATYTLDLSDWKNSTLTFTEGSTGSAKIVITDYFYCTATVIYLNPEQAAEKFTANSVLSKDAYTQITLGTLFGVKDGATISNVTATVTDPNGNETTITGTSSDWTTKTIDLTKEGSWTVAIKDDDAYCAVTTVTFTVNKVDKFTKKFDKDFLYRVGNVNTVTIGTIFGEIETTIKLSSVNVNVENVAGNAAGTYTSNATWTTGTIKFTGTGVVKITISADGANPVELCLEVVDATNITSATGTTTGGDMVLLCDVNTSTYVNYWNCTLYGNGFTYSLNGAPTAYNSKQGHGVIITKNATLDNLVIVGDVYTAYGAYSTQDYYNSAVDVLGETTIQNCYIANCAAPVLARASVTITNTTLYGGTVANLLIKSGVATLENVTTANYDDGRNLVGMGIVIHSDATAATKLVLSGTLTQYNFISEANTPSDSNAKMLYNAMFDDSCSKYHFGTTPNLYVNAGIISMTANFGEANIVDNANTGYSGSNVTVNNVNGYVYTQLNTNGSVNNDYDKGNDSHIATTQGPVAPSYSFDYTNKNYVAKTDGSNDYCYEENGIVYVSMDEGDTFNWDTAILTATKLGQTLSYTVSMNGTDYTGKSIAFNTAGSYEVIYTYTDDSNYGVDKEGDIITYSKTYTKTVYITVATVKAAWKDAEIKVTNTAMSGIYVMSGDYDYSYKMKFLDCITITDYDEDGNTITVTLSEGIASTSFVDVNGANPGKFDANNGTITITYSNGKTLTVKIGAWSGSGPSTKTCSVKTDDGVYLITDGASNAANTGVTWKITGYTYTGNNGKVVSNNTTITFTWDTNSVGYNSKDSGGCFTPDTLITLADGTQKRIDELLPTDKILAWDFFTGTYVEKEISLLVNHGEDLYRVANLGFSDGTELKVIAEHGIFDYDLNKFVYLSVDNMSEYIGHRFVKYAAGTYDIVTLTSAYETEEYASAWSISSAVTSNAFASGLLTVAPPEDFYNWIEMDGKLHYDVEQFQKDVETYGLYTYEDFADYVTEEQFVEWNGAYLKIAVEKGYFSFDYILELIEMYKIWMP